MRRQIQGLLGLCSLAVMVCLFSGEAFAQTGTTSLRGTVTDKTGSAVVGAKVTIRNAAQGLQREELTKETGDYEFLLLPPGGYEVVVEFTGFSKYERHNLQLLVNSPATLNVTLEIGAASETVEVSGDAQRINTVDATLGIAFGENQVKQLPLEGRNVPDLLSLQPGVAYTGNRADVPAFDTRSGAVNGARSDQSNVTLDGIQVNDEGGHAFTSVLPVTLDSVQEFRVTTSNANADQGSAGGAQVALVTKTGTNDFHGSLYEYNRNTATSANDYFIKSTQLANGEPNKAPKLIRNIFGASIGGPVKKDRLFFFLNYEGTRRIEETSVTNAVPSAAMRDGIIQYPCADPTQCAGATVQGISGQSYAISPGSIGLTPQNLTQFDPRHI